MEPGPEIVKDYCHFQDSPDNNQSQLTLGGGGIVQSGRGSNRCRHLSGCVTEVHKRWMSHPLGMTGRTGGTSRLLRKLRECRNTQRRAGNQNLSHTSTSQLLKFLSWEPDISKVRWSLSASDTNSFQTQLIKNILIKQHSTNCLFKTPHAGQSAHLGRSLTHTHTHSSKKTQNPK